MIPIVTPKNVSYDLWKTQQVFKYQDAYNVAEDLKMSDSWDHYPMLIQCRGLPARHHPFNRRQSIAAIFVLFVLIVLNPIRAVVADSVAEAIASGTQDLAALAGLFCTDSVEENFLRMQLGYGTVLVSSLSLLGILGLTRGCLKLFLGLQNCNNAAFSPATIRGFYGYGKDESPENGKTFDTVICSTTNEDDYVHITKKAQKFTAVTKPMLKVASAENKQLMHTTVINLGKTGHNPFLMAFLVVLCTGATSWLLVCISYPWTWVRFVAIPGLHWCLISMIAIPLFHEWQTSRPGRHITSAKWKAIQKGNVKCFRFAHSAYPSKYEEELDFNKRAIARLPPPPGHDVLHFQATSVFADNLFFRPYLLVISIATVVAYICQYAIVKDASNTRSIVWISCQAVAALLRFAYWIFAPVESSETGESFVALDNRWSRSLTFAELLCSWKPDKSSTTRVRKWAWRYLLETDLRELLESIVTSWHEPVPGTAEKLSGLDFGQVMRNRVPELAERRSYYNTEAYMSKLSGTEYEYRWSLWLSRNGDVITPHISVELRVLENRNVEMNNNDRRERRNEIMNSFQEILDTERQAMTSDKTMRYGTNESWLWCPQPFDQPPDKNWWYLDDLTFQSSRSLKDKLHQVFCCL